jgi:CDP-diacylglycerol--glycerol-3-phosphate 3-phosphatidyltransferase
MIARSILRCSATRPLATTRSSPLRAKYRRYSTTSSTNPVHTSSPVSMLAAFTDELDKIAPRFDIEGSQIKILGTPAEFYETLKVNWIRSLGRFEADVQ